MSFPHIWHFSATMRVRSFEKCSYTAVFARRRVVASVSQDLGRISGFAIDLRRDCSIIVTFCEDIEENLQLIGPRFYCPFNAWDLCGTDNPSCYFVETKELSQIPKYLPLRVTSLTNNYKQNFVT